VIKNNRHLKFDELRQRFRLTPTEKRVAVFVVAAFVLGLATKCYRDAHPSPAPVQNRARTTMTSTSTHWTPADATRRTQRSAEKHHLPDSAPEQEYQQK